MREVVVGLDLHLKNTQGVVMTSEGEVIKSERFPTTQEDLEFFLSGLPEGTKVALESLGFCWPWIDFIEELGYKPLLANPAKAKQRAEDVKSDKVDAEVLAHLTRMNWLPTSYVPSKELRMLRSFLRHRAALRRCATAFKNRTWSELRKRGMNPKIDLGTIKGREITKTIAKTVGVLEIQQDIGAIELLEEFRKKDEKVLKESQFASRKPVQLLQTIPGVGLVTVMTLYAEICDINRFANPDKLAHVAGLVPRVRQSGENMWTGREVRANKWLKWILIEAAWSHIRLCPEGRLAKVFAAAYKRKHNKKKAIKIVARKLVNVIWAMWKYGREFHDEE